VVAARDLLGSSALRLSSEGNDLLARAVERLPLSGRGRARVLRVSETIAALAGADSIGTEHVAEALSYRTPSELCAS
jgi:magnesium chelatase family protein